MLARKTQSLIGRFMLLSLLATPALAGSLTLEWDPADTASGYKVHYGTNPGNPTEVQDVGNTTQATITGLANCTDIYFSVTAYNAAGESGPSNEIGNWAMPELASATPTNAMQGEQVTLSVRGNNFHPTATLEIDNENVVLGGVTTVGCDEIQTVATVEPTANNVRAAEVGRFTLTITNPDGLSVAAQAFEVVIDPSRFDVNDSDDMTRDRIDGKDTVWLSRRFGSRDGQALFQPNFDFNGDGWVDGEDLAHIASNLGRCWDGSSWRTSVCANR